MSETLKRYTQLPFLVHMLETKSLALLSPSSWDDRNDARYLEVYKERSRFTSVLALCLTEASTTYHHWRIFADSMSGVCVEFFRKPFSDWAEQNGIRCAAVKYMSLKRARRNRPTPEALPFRKRHAFRDEREVRLIYASHESCGSIKSFPLDLRTIEHIEVNPWLPEGAFNSLHDSIRRIPGCESLKVEQSHMLTNKEWAGLSEGDAPTSTYRRSRSDSSAARSQPPRSAAAS
jgi:hypothetical protein